MAELPKGGSTCLRVFRSKGGVVTGRLHRVVGVSRIGLEILSLKMLLIEMHDLFAC